MNRCEFHAIEAHVFGELGPAEAAEIKAHLAACPACAAEASLLREERGLFAQRARIGPAAHGFAAALARSRWGVSPIVEAAPPPLPAPRSFPWAALSLAAAAAFVGVVALPGMRGAATAPAEGVRFEATASTGPASAEPVPGPEEICALDRATAALEAEPRECVPSYPEPPRGEAAGGERACATEGRFLPVDVSMQ